MLIAVLGAGMVGRAIALDLANDHDVTAFDLSKNNLALLEERKGIKTASADLTDYQWYADVLKPFDIVVTAVPGFMGYKTLEAVINAGKHVVDISFFPEDALQLQRLAVEKEAIAITDCGVAPGMSNLILGRYNEEFKVESFECYVGGLPKDRSGPFQYKAPFSPVDVIQEYIRPARLVENGVVVTKPALSDREIRRFEGVGDLEAFNTDGLRSLIFTMDHIPQMLEKTLRYPGHIDLVMALKEAGFFDTAALHVGESDVIPLDFTSKLLVDQWKLEPGDEEFTVMQVIVKGGNITVQYDLFDEYDAASQLSSMARTTGFTCTAAVNLVAKGLFTRIGVNPPEFVGKDKRCFDFIIDYLAARHVRWQKKLVTT